MRIRQPQQASLVGVGTAAATDSFEAGLLGMILRNTTVPNVGDATGLRGSTTAGSFFLSLHTGDPTETGNQTSSEATYTGYARVAVTRISGNWTISAGAAANAVVVSFGACTAGSNTLNFFGIGSDVSGAGNLFMIGTLAVPAAVSVGIIPIFAVGDLIATLD